MQTVVESICKFIKLTMRCIKHLFGQFVEPYFKIIVQNYEVYLNNTRKNQFLRICTQ